MLPRVKARRLLQFTTSELWDNLEGDMVLIFDDGEVLTNEKRIIYSSYTWEYHKRYPETPLLKSHLLSLPKGTRAGAETHLSLINAVLLSTYDTYSVTAKDKVALIDELAKMSYEISNTMYNDLSYRCEAFVTSLDILDFVGITTHPKIKEALASASPTEEGIQNVYSAIRELVGQEEMTGNQVANVIQAKLVSEGQAMQCLGPRGFLTDIDSQIFKIPIMRSYTAGLTDMYSSLVDSRSSAKSLVFSTDPLQKSEYFSRRQQLICMNVKHLHLGDCGSTKYQSWKVRDARMVGATKATSDLKTLAGKYYLDDATQTLKVIGESDYHLIGQTLKLRSVVAGCAHPDPYGVCEVCYGANSFAIPANSNLGHIACVTMTSDLGQVILSTKHFDGTSVVEGIVLKPVDKRFLHAPVNGNMYYLAPELKNSEVQLLIASSQAPGLSDINHVDNVEVLNIARVSEFDQIGMVVKDKKGSETYSATVSVSGRQSSMTHQLLKHIKVKGFEVTRDGHFLVDMTGWDFSQPILVLPMRHFNMSHHQSDIADLLEATMKELEYRSTTVNPQDMLIQLHDLVNRRLSINLSILEIILYSSMVVSAMENDYSLPKPWTEYGVGVKQALLTERSLGATMGFERHRDTLINPASYIRTNRLDHVFDVLIAPQLLNSAGVGK